MLLLNAFETDQGVGQHDEGCANRMTGMEACWMHG